MSVIAVDKNPTERTLTLTCEFQATAERVWQLWADPRQLERWWGPPNHPATVTSFDLRPGGRVAYHLTGARGEHVSAYLEFDELEPPHKLVLREGFANADGSPDSDLPVTTMRVTIETVGDARTRMLLRTLFADAAEMEQLLGMGMEQGLQRALGQIDELLAEGSGGPGTAEDGAEPPAEPITHTLEVPGAVLTYDVRPNPSSREPVLFLIGSPMGAAGFATLARHFTDRTVVTYDPRGVERSRRTADALPSTPEVHADDLSRLIGHLGLGGAGGVDLFASSGGAVNALALLAAHPNLLRTVVAHEPPLIPVLPDRDVALRVSLDIHDTYQGRGFGAAMAKFISLVVHEGELPADYLERPEPEPANFGLPSEDDGSRDDPLLGQNIVSGTHYEPDWGTLREAQRRASTRLILAVGAESGSTLACRAGRAAAERLGQETVVFPGGHTGFVGGEHGQTGEPDAFAATLRTVLAGG